MTFYLNKKYDLRSNQGNFLKKYLIQLIKRQWGQNLIKFQGVKLPGGIELNGRPTSLMRSFENIIQIYLGYIVTNRHSTEHFNCL